MKYKEIFENSRTSDFIRSIQNKFLSKVKSKYDSMDPSDQKIMGDNPLQFLVTADPTSNKSYTQWLINLFLKNELRPEDAGKASSYLSIFDKHKHRLPIKDIYKISSLPELYNLVKEYDVFVGKLPTTKGIEELIKSHDISVVYRGAEGAIYQVHTEKGACYLGRGTEWCTTYGDPFGKYPDRADNQFQKYSSDLKVIFTKDGRFQFNLFFALLADENDNDIISNAVYFKNKFPWVFANMHYSEVDKKIAIMRFPSSLVFMNDCSEKLKLLAIQKNVFSIRYVENPSEELQLAAVKEDPHSIQWIKKPTEKVQLVAVTEDGYAIETIKNPSDAVQIAAVKQDRSAVEVIQYPCYAVMDMLA